jgi:hypothetical protein
MSSISFQLQEELPADFERKPTDLELKMAETSVRPARSLTVHQFRQRQKDIDERYPRLAMDKDRFLMNTQRFGGVLGKFPEWRDFEIGDHMLERFARTSAFARSLVANVIRLNGHLILNRENHKDSSGRYTSYGIGSHNNLLMVSNTVRTPLQEFFQILAHEIGHMHCRVSGAGIAPLIWAIQKEPSYRRQIRALGHSVSPKIPRIQPMRERTAKYIRYFYSAGKFKQYRGTLEETIAEGFATIVQRLGDRRPSHLKHSKQMQGRQRPYHRRHKLMVKELCMPALSFLVKTHLPQHDIHFNAPQKGRMGLKPGKKYKIHPIQARAFKVPGQKWV